MALQEHRTAWARSLPSPAAGVPVHVVVRVTDVASAAAWFARVAGLRLLQVAARRVVLGDPVSCAPLLSLIPGRSADGAAPGTRLTLTVPTRIEWLAATGAAAAAGGTVLRVLDHGTERAAHLDGPDGLEVALAWRSDPDGGRRGAVARPTMALDPRTLDGAPAASVAAEESARGLGGLHLPVEDLVAARTFWAVAAGLDEVAGDERSAFFRAPGGDGHVCVGVSTHHGGPSAGALGPAALVLRGAMGADHVAPGGLRVLVGGSAQGDAAAS